MILTRDRVANYALVKDIVDRSVDNGIMFDRPKLEALHISLRDSVEEDYTKLEEQTWKDISINSHNQIRHLFNEVYDCSRYAGRTKAGGQSFDQEALIKIYENEGIEAAKLIMDIRSNTSKANKVQELYLACDENGYVHPSWVYGETNRIYYNSPSISNLADEIKSCLAAPEGYTLVSFDYSQQEPWILFHWLGIGNMIELIKTEKDTYRALAKALLGYTDVTEEERSKIKTAWLSASYGAGVPTIAKKVGKEFAKKFHSAIEAIPEIKALRDEIYKRVARQDYEVESFFGSVRTIPYGNDRYIARAMFNNRFQMTGSEILMFGIEDTYNYLNGAGYTEDEARFYFSLHDEIVFVIKTQYLSCIEKLEQILAYQVEDWEPFKLSVDILK